MRAILCIIVFIVVVILALEIFISTDIETHTKISDIVVEHAIEYESKIEHESKSEHDSHVSKPIDITSFIQTTITNKKWMKYFKSSQPKMTSENECNELNWMNGLYEIFEPLNKWSFYDDINVIKYSSSIHINEYINKTIILIMDKQSDLNHNKDYNISDLSTFTKWTMLGESSLLIRRIFDVNDIDLIGRFIEYLWAKNWMGHIRNDPRCTPKNDHCRDILLKSVIVETVACWKCGCIIEKQTTDQSKWKPIIANTTFYKIAATTLTDKIQFHMYHRLYGKHLELYYYTNEGVFLEIGLGCNMIYGPGHSGKIWIELFNNVQFIEYDKNCTDKYRAVIDESGYIVHVGSQDDIIFMEELKEIYWSKIGLDIIIDDGGHFNKQIISSFLQLWPILNDNGLYFIEDYQESAYIIDYLDSKPITYWGEEQPGTAQYFIKKQLLYQLFCSITGRSCNDMSYIECIRDICVFKKRIIVN